jgi:hypothetical protein
MKTEIWQTTNQQPWVEALASGLITAKTRTSYPVVPIGAKVLLHASKSRLWPHHRGLSWTLGMDPKKWDRGNIVAVAEVVNVGPSNRVLTRNEQMFWDVFYIDSGGAVVKYNSVAEWTVRFKNIKRLKNPVPAKGFLAPFARAKEDTIKEVIKQNPEIKEFLST